MIGILYQCILIFFISLLSSCSHVSKKDGPPNFYVDETKVCDAVPKSEPLSKYGNKSKYYVFGKHYHVMRSSKNYEAYGIASWYGTQFHARKTSSGEPYNMLAMTAAHRSLPLPTYVEVKNLENNRKIIVKVNDRGPFHSNRIIDLSYVAAKKLGMLKRGTAKVRIRAIDTSPYRGISSFWANFTRKKPTPPVIKPRDVYLQVGAFKDLQNARKLRQRLLTQLTEPVQIFSPSFKEKLYRVRIGPIKDIATADKITKHLQRLGLSR